eukprot:COSAG05_NODE_874_length_6832_cov_2.914303_2_plen_98_part_00
MRWARSPSLPMVNILPVIMVQVQPYERYCHCRQYQHYQLPYVHQDAGKVVDHLPSECQLPVLYQLRPADSHTFRYRSILVPAEIIYQQQLAAMMPPQ